AQRGGESEIIPFVTHRQFAVAQVVLNVRIVILIFGFFDPLPGSQPHRPAFSRPGGFDSDAVPAAGIIATAAITLMVDAYTEVIQAPAQQLATHGKSPDQL